MRQAVVLIVMFFFIFIFVVVVVVPLSIGVADGGGLGSPHIDFRRALAADHCDIESAGIKATSFVGGDADPSNVSSLVRGEEMRVAETRAVNRALRKAYGIGICSVEEIGTIPSLEEKLPPQNTNGKPNGNGNGAGPKVRDRLCQIIRKHRLDAELVKAYAVDKGGCCRSGCRTGSHGPHLQWDHSNSIESAGV